MARAKVSPTTLLDRPTLPKAPRRKLKVFQAQFGFYDTVVAAASRAAALRAWGTRQDLFAGGQAHITEDPQAIEAALAYPGTPLKRAVGSLDPFALNSISLPKIPDAAKKVTAKALPKTPSAPAPKPPPDRCDLDAAEAALKRVDEARKRQEAEFRARQDELDSARSSAQASYVAARRTATADVVRARLAYRNAGGGA